eukprot:663888-Alexandrium_andersonii.AAC.1
MATHDIDGGGSPPPLPSDAPRYALNRGPGGGKSDLVPLEQKHRDGSDSIATASTVASSSVDEQPLRGRSRTRQGVGRKDKDQVSPLPEGVATASIRDREVRSSRGLNTGG